MPFVVCVLSARRKCCPTLKVLPKLYPVVDENLFKDLAVYLFDQDYICIDEEMKEWCVPSQWQAAADNTSENHNMQSVPTDERGFRMYLSKYATNEQIVKWLCWEYGESNFEADYSESWRFEIREVN